MITDAVNVKLQKGNLEGSLNAIFSPEIDYAIIFPDDLVRDQIKQYLETPKEFRVNKSDDPNIMDDFDIITEKPTMDAELFRLTLCTLFADTGVRVIW